MNDTTNTTAVETKATETAVTDTTTAVETDSQATGTDEQLNSFQKFLATLGLGSGKKEAETKEEDSKKDEGTKETGKNFTQTDVDAAIAKAQKDWETKAKEKAELEKLSPEERSKAEAAAKDQEVTNLKAQLLAKELKETAVSSLSKDGFPVELANLVDYTSKENMEKSLAAVQDVFKNSLAAALKEKLKGKTPSGLGGAANGEGSMKDLIARNIRGGLA